MQEWKKRDQIAGVENAGVSRMERQPEIILRQSQVTSLYLSLFLCKQLTRDLFAIAQFVFIPPCIRRPPYEGGGKKLREWKMRYWQNCNGGKCRSGKCGSR